MTIEIPDALKVEFKQPLLAGLSIASTTNGIVEAASAPAFSRSATALSGRADKTVSLSLVFNGRLYLEFVRFFEVSLSYGTREFNWAFPVAGSVVLGKSRFNPPTYTTVPMRNLWRVSFTLLTSSETQADGS